MTDAEREFVGFFWGEGSIIFMGRQSAKGYPRRGFRLCLVVKLRSDDRFLLEHFQKMFGGKIYDRKRGLIPTFKGTILDKPLIANPASEWMVFRRNECLKILSILEQGILPAKKRRELIFARKLINMVPQKGISKFGNRWSDEQIKEQEKLKDQILSTRVFKST